MTVTDMVSQIGEKRGHDMVFVSLGNSGRYKYACQDCNQQINFYEGEFFGGAIDYACKKKEG